MSAPILASVAAELYRSLLPLAFADPENGYPLAHFCGAIGAPIQEIDDLVRDSSAGPGWSALVDVDRCPSWALPWLAQLAGVALTEGVTELEQRALIRDASSRRRGTVPAMVAAAQPYLTGDKTVVVTERDGSAYRISVVTRTSETPDPNAVFAALLSQKAAGLILNYVNLDGQTYQSLFTNNATYQTVFTKYATYKGALYDQPGT